MRPYILLYISMVMRSQALSYWVDTSCTGKLSEAANFDEIRQMGTEGGNRMRDTTDAVFGAVLQQIFKVDRTDPAASSAILTAMDTIAALTPTLDWKTSDIRFYCDNDANAVSLTSPNPRWVLVPDATFGKKKNRNSKQMPENQQTWDPTNFIYRGLGSVGCQDGLTSAQTYQLKTGDDPGIADGQPAGRATITICDLGFSDTGEFATLNAIPADSDITTARTSDTFEDYQDMLSITIFHELCHVEGILDIPGDETANGWDALLDVTAAQALKESDAFAILGFTAIMNARNLRIAADPAAQAAGDITWITVPVAPTRRRRRAVSFWS